MSTKPNKRRPEIEPHRASHYVGRKYLAIDKDAMAALKKIPPDDRDFTQRFFGDPIPQRSALYQKRQEP